MMIEDQIMDLVSDPESEYYTLVHWGHNSATFNAPVAEQIAKELGSNVTWVSANTIEWEESNGS